MIVVDASAVLEVILRTPEAEEIEERLLGMGENLCAPHLLDLEVAQVLRRFASSGEISSERAIQALDDLASLPIHRYPHSFLLERIWELRHNVTAYDAAYVALAESLAAPLVTRDARLAAAPGLHTEVELV
jgi:predicted nucleic acid-binding protein